MDLQFKNIESDNIESMMPYYSMRPNRTCDSVFLESFIWKEFYNVRYAIWENKAILWLMEHDGHCFSAMPLCREEDLPSALKAIETYFNEELGRPLIINLADEFAVKYLNLPETEYFIKEQIDSKDYIYTGDSLRTLAGKSLHKKKNHLNAFIREYGEQAEYRALCCSDSHVVWEFLDKWRETKGEEVDEHLEYEVKGIHDILKNCSNLNIRMGGVFINGELEAFSMGSYNPIEDMAIIHIEKANPEIRGLYQFINQQFLLAEYPNVQWVNREDDLGLEGLRKAKMSYCPVDFARKYLVEQIVDGKHDYKWAEEIGNTMSGEDVMYVHDIEASETKGLWREAFPEDSEGFLDYYYSEKIKENHLLVKKQNGFLVSMLHLNPYKMQIGQSEWEVAYIVGVATENGSRHQGHMTDLFNRMMGDMAAAGTPFTFLMPADERIYLPFSFTFIFSQPNIRLKEQEAETLTRAICTGSEEDCIKAADYMEAWLSSRYEVYCKRDTLYVARLVKELESEDGQLLFLYDGETLAGLLAHWGIEKKQQRLLYAEERYVEVIDEKLAIMGRIISAEAFLKAFALKKEVKQDMSICLQITDPQIEANNGSFVWTLTSLGSEVNRIAAGEKPMVPAVKERGAEGYEEECMAAAALNAVCASEEMPVLSTDIQKLISWLFGCQKAETLWPELSENIISSLNLVNTVHGVFIDEVV